ncbi:MAG: hypothetical protein Q8P46_11980 [Hyphomicrobiales bacterium]|nr:hypothetical protein [Hyphomicrobiales bacterium]
MPSIPTPKAMLIDEMDAAREHYALHEAQIEGARAGRMGLASALNPYRPGSEDYEQWHRAWHSATAQRVAAQLRERIK